MLAGPMGQYRHADPVRASQEGNVATSPNIVFILVDNVGWGNFGVYAGTISTPRIDQLANQGIRFNNYNVEAQCTPRARPSSLGAIQFARGPSRSHFPGGDSPGCRRGNTPSPNSCPTLAMRPRCTASGTSATNRADCRTIKDLTSGGGS